MFQTYHGRWSDFDLEGLEIDHTISDPPYTAKVHAGMVNGFRQRVSLGFDSYDPHGQKEGIAKLSGIASRWTLLFCAIEHIGVFAEIVPDRWVRGMAWVKPDAMPQFSGDRPAMWGECIAAMHSEHQKKRWNAKGKKGIYTHTICREAERFHETQKPLALMMDLIRDFTEEGDTIFDPYMGSGTTGVAALMLGRNFIGCEINKEYYDKAVERLQAAQEGFTSVEQHRAGQGMLI